MTRVIQIIHPRDMQYLKNELRGDYDTCTMEYCIKPRYRAIDDMHVGIKLLYEHIRTPRGFLTQRIPSPKAKRTEQRSFWKVRKNDPAFQMNRPVREVLKEDISCFLIMEPNRIVEKRRRTMTNRVFRRNRFFKCYDKETKREREREREKKDTESQQKIRHKKEEKEMCNA